MAKLGEVAELNLGKMLDQKKNKGTKRKYLANVDVRWGSFNLGNLKEMPFQDSELERYGLKFGDIVMCEGGEPGRCAIWKEPLPGIMFQKALHRIRPHKELDYRFLYYGFLLRGRHNGFDGLFTGSTIKHLPKDKLALVEIPLPPLPVQRRIADILSAYDDLIENNRKRIALLEESARQLYREWFVRLRFPGYDRSHHVVGSLPKGWEYCRLPDMIDINPLESRPKSATIRYVPMAALSMTDMVIDCTVTELRENSTSVRFRNGDTLLARITPCLENGKTGFVNFLSQGEVACGSTEFIVLRGKTVSPAFVYCLARTDDFRETAIKSMIGSSGRQRVQSSCLAEYPVWQPPEPLLDRFDCFSRPLFKQIAVLSREAERLTSARDALLSRLMKGVRCEG